MFGLFKKKPPTKAGLAYQRIQAALEPVFEMETLAKEGGAPSSWVVNEKASREHLFMLYLSGRKGSSVQIFHDDDIERLHIEAEGVWSGRKLTEAEQSTLKEAVAPYTFEMAELMGPLGKDWRVVTKFEVDLEPDTQALLDELNRFADACRKAYRILES